MFEDFELQNSGEYLYDEPTSAQRTLMKLQNEVKAVALGNNELEGNMLAISNVWKEVRPHTDVIPAVNMMFDEQEVIILAPTVMDGKLIIGVLGLALDTFTVFELKEDANTGFEIVRLKAMINEKSVELNNDSNWLIRSFESSGVLTIEEYLSILHKQEIEYLKRFKV